MFKKLFLAFTLLTGALLAQNVTVKGTVVNSDGTPLAGGVITATLTNAAGMTYDQLPYNAQTANIPVQQASTILDATGYFSLSLESNAQVTGSYWTFKVCSPSANTQCATITQGIVTSVNLSLPLSAAISNAVNPNGKATQAYVDNVLATGSLNTRLLPPPGFVWPNLPVQVYTTTGGGVTTPFDVASLKSNAAITYYADAVNGSDSNNCLSAVLACLHITHAYSLQTASKQIATLHVAAGHYSRGGGDLTTNPTISINEICDAPGQCFISSDIATPTYTQLLGSTYQATEATQVGEVMDTSRTDSDGYFVQLMRQGSIAAVEANADSWFWSANVLYVNLATGNVPDSKVWVYDTAHAGLLHQAGNVTLYAEGFTYVGGFRPVFAQCSANCDNGPFVLALKNDTIYGSAIASNQGLTVSQGTSTIYPTLSFTQNLIVRKNNTDAISYASTNASSPALAVYAVEINNTAGDSVWYDATAAQGNVMNASTEHFAGSVIRINGWYGNTFGPPIGDGGGASSWTVGSTVTAAQLAATPNTMNFNLANGTLNTSVAWTYNVNMPTTNGATYAVQAGVVAFVQNPIGVFAGYAANIVPYTNPSASATVPPFQNAVNDSLVLNSLLAPFGAFVTNNGTTGATTYTYSIAACSINGNCGPAATISTTTGFATLGGTSNNTITWSAVSTAATYRIWRTVGGVTGYIGSTNTNSLTDTGFVGDGTSVPAATAGLLILPSAKATTGTRFACIDTNGVITSSASACSGT